MGLNKPKVLIVEDEIIVALDIKRAIINLNFEVTNITTNYDETLKSIKNNEPNIIIMDINLKNSLDGIKTVERIQKTKNIPIIYLTAFCDDETINRAIKTNPVGYLIKPFKTAELKSTILLAIFKTTQNRDTKNSYKRLGYSYYYDDSNFQLYYINKPIKLTTKESQLLNILYKKKGEVVEFDIIENIIWEDNTVSNSTLRTLIYRLRAKLEYKLIETIPTIGCRLNIIGNS